MCVVQPQRVVAHAVPGDGLEQGDESASALAAPGSPAIRVRVAGPIRSDDPSRAYSAR